MFPIQWIDWHTLYLPFMITATKVFILLGGTDKKLERREGLLLLFLFSHLVMSDSLQPHGLQHTRLPCPSPSPRGCSNSCPSRWCRPTISSCRPLLFLPSVFPSIRVFSSESVLYIRWPKYWSFSFSISPSNEYSGLISFKINWFDLLAVQGTLKSLLQHHNSKESVLWCSAFFSSDTTVNWFKYNLPQCS